MRRGQVFGAEMLKSIMKFDLISKKKYNFSSADLRFHIERRV